jgi:hypothetical protein
LARSGSVKGIGNDMNSNPEMKGWKSYVLWEGLPFLIIFFLFGSISALNWAYESKLVTPDVQASRWVDVHLGTLLLTVAVGQASFAAFILFIVRLTLPKSRGAWYMFISLTMVSVFLIFPAAFIVILGPAAITMKQQMRTESR